MLDLHTLEQFVTFYRSGTLIEAAEQLHISQSTLTRSMQRIEAEFKVSLFERTKNSISLTEAG
ncbi:MAG: LysR family transcriptional regulator [Lachnospiraceae bacterium]|nr:LysR family transcriptional regulator [Lachnospiraceae bacterium]